MAPITDRLLTAIANSAGTVAVLLIVVYQFIEINAKRQREAIARGELDAEGNDKTATEHVARSTAVTAKD
ncbi:oligosaccaryltransferase family protein [Pseudohyphozyma bogoriensis]|nr:oligosaccaryltransferase family protein [Pseudohyphozyma bogoriensis]